LKDTEGSTYTQVEYLLADLSKNHIRLLFFSALALLTLTILYYHKVLYARQSCLAFQVQHIRLYLFLPHRLLIYILLNPMVAFLRIMFFQRLASIIFNRFILWNVYTHLSWTFHSQDVRLVAYCCGDFLL
jgi:hypothetical protein